jgi:hypothetical protein
MLYNGLMNEANGQIYTPEIQSRRSELVSWGLAGASLIGLLILNFGVCCVYVFCSNEHITRELDGSAN